MDKIRVSAKTKDEAITKALIQLHTTSDRLSYHVLVQGSNGLFGIGAKPWILEASVREEEEKLTEPEKTEKIVSGSERREETAKLNEAEEEKREPATRAALHRSEESPRKEREERTRRPERERRFDRERVPKEKRFSRGGYDPIEPAVPFQTAERTARELRPVSEEEAQQISEKAVQFLRSVLAGMKMEVSVRCSFRHESNELLVNLEGPDMGILIGKRGQTLDSLQYLCSLAVNREHKEEYIRIKLDTEDYRRRREQTLRNLAKNIAYKVKRSHKPVSLEPMNPYERRIIHAALQGDRFATTRSEGEEPFRHVVIFAKSNAERGGRYAGSRPAYGGRSGASRNRGYSRDYSNREWAERQTEGSTSEEKTENAEHTEV